LSDNPCFSKFFKKYIEVTLEVFRKQITKNENNAFPSTKNIDKSNKESKPSALNLLKCKCPRGRRGDMSEDRSSWHLKNTLKMNKVCPVCGSLSILK
jgi:hypothetical protein